MLYANNYWLYYYRCGLLLNYNTTIHKKVISQRTLPDGLLFDSVLNNGYDSKKTTFVFREAFRSKSKLQDGIQSELCQNTATFRPI